MIYIFSTLLIYLCRKNMKKWQKDSEKKLSVVPSINCSKATVTLTVASLCLISNICIKCVLHNECGCLCAGNMCRLFVLWVKLTRDLLYYLLKDRHWIPWCVSQTKYSHRDFQHRRWLYCWYHLPYWIWPDRRVCHSLCSLVETLCPTVWVPNDSSHTVPTTLNGVLTHCVFNKWRCIVK